MRSLLHVPIVIATVTGTVLCAPPSSFEFGRFGLVQQYALSAHPSHVVILLSGDGGWEARTDGMAKVIASLDALVLGVDAVHYIARLEESSEECSYPAADIEALSKYAQMRLGYPNYVIPVVSGYSSGATLAYAILVQSPPNTYLGAVSVGFCPDLPLTKPLCRGSGLDWTSGPGHKGFKFLPAKNLPGEWIVVQGEEDRACLPSVAADYAGRIQGARLVSVPAVGHGFGKPVHWAEQFREAFGDVFKRRPALSTVQADPVKDLPLVEVPATDPKGDTFAVILSGDGGWAGIDRELGNELAARGIPAVGLNSLQYFWTRRTPDGAAKDLERILRHYLPEWHKEKVILAGYSLGADVLPFMVARLPEDLRKRTQLVALVGPEQRADFEFHLTDWLGGRSRDTEMPILPEVQKLQGSRILCVCGSGEADSLCKIMPQNLAKVITMSGGHHFGGDYKGIVTAILEEARRGATEK